MGRIAPDSNDVLVYPLNESVGGTRINYGTAGTAGNLTDYGSPLSGVPSKLEIDGDFKGMYTPGSIISPNKDGASGANSILITPNISVSCWVFIRKYSGYGQIISKQYTDGAWSSPFLSIGLYVNNSNDGRWIAYVTTSGTLRTLLMGTNYIIPQNSWAHVGCTWNGTTLTAYLNGTATGTLVPGGGGIDYGTVPGDWFIGSVPDTGTLDSPSMIIQDLRVANVVRPQSYFQNIYKNGILNSGTGNIPTVQYYKLRAYDTVCGTPIYWISTSPDLTDAPAAPCSSLGSLEIMDTWIRRGFE